jgi:hypothetical protein
MNALSIAAALALNPVQQLPLLPDQHEVFKGWVLAPASTLNDRWGMPALKAFDPPSPWLKELSERFAAVRKLPDGWDGPSSVAVDPTLVGRIDRVLKDALAGVASPKLPFVVPSADGGLQIEWHRRDLDLEVFFSREGQVSALLEDRKGGVELERNGAEALNLLFCYAGRVAAVDPDGAYASPAPASAQIAIAA